MTMMIFIKNFDDDDDYDNENVDYGDDDNENDDYDDGDNDDDETKKTINRDETEVSEGGVHGLLTLPSI